METKITNEPSNINGYRYDRDQIGTCAYERSRVRG